MMYSFIGVLGITADIGEEAFEEVLESCVRQWVTVHQYSFAKNVMELYKQETKKCTSKSQALCKTLCTAILIK